MSSQQDKTYNGWANYATWNIALWIGNDEGLYNLALECKDYKEFRDIVLEMGSCTPDGVDWDDSSLDIDELDADIREMKGDS